MEEETPVEMTPEIMEPEPAADETSVIEDGLEIINEPVSGEEETPATMQLLDTSWGDEDVPVDVMEYHGTELMIDASISDPAEGESLLSVEEQQLLYAIIDTGGDQELLRQEYPAIYEWVEGSESYVGFLSTTFVSEDENQPPPPVQNINAAGISAYMGHLRAGGVVEQGLLNDLFGFFLNGGWSTARAGHPAIRQGLPALSLGGQNFSPANYNTAVAFFAAVRNRLAALEGDAKSAAYRDAVRWMADFNRRLFIHDQNPNVPHPVIGGSDFSRASVHGNKYCGVCVASSEFLFYVSAALLPPPDNTKLGPTYVIVTPRVLQPDGTFGAHQAALIQLPNGRWMVLDQGGAIDLEEGFDPARAPAVNLRVGGNTWEAASLPSRIFYFPDDRAVPASPQTLYAAAIFLKNDRFMRKVVVPAINAAQRTRTAQERIAGYWAVIRLLQRLDDNFASRIGDMADGVLIFNAPGRYTRGGIQIQIPETGGNRQRPATADQYIATLYVQMAQTHHDAAMFHQQQSQNMMLTQAIRDRHEALYRENLGQAAAFIKTAVAILPRGYFTARMRTTNGNSSFWTLEEFYDEMVQILEVNWRTFIPPINEPPAPAPAPVPAPGSVSLEPEGSTLVSAPADEIEDSFLTTYDSDPTANYLDEYKV